MEERADLERELLGFYQTMLTKPNVSKYESIQQVLTHVPSLINEDHNDSLMKPISMHEVETTIKQMVEGKAPGLDDFTINCRRVKEETVGSPHPQCYSPNSNSQGFWS